MTKLVLLPGMDGTGDLFAPFLHVIGPGVETHVVRYPGNRTLDYAELLALAKASLPPDSEYFILGESFSGPIAVLLAADKPPGLRGLILTCSFVKNPRPLFGPLRFLLGLLPAMRPPSVALSWSLLGRFATWELEQSIRVAMTKVSAQAMRSRLEAVIGVDVTEELKAVSVPVLYLRASEDRLVPPAAGRLIKETRKSTQVVDVPGPHFLLQTQPAACAASVAQFTSAVLSGKRFQSEPAKRVCYRQLG